MVDFGVFSPTKIILEPCESRHAPLPPDPTPENFFPVQEKIHLGIEDVPFCVEENNPDVDPQDFLCREKFYSV